ncbi:hypothetical protein Peur_036127 [Populus x canadensis]
MVVRNTRNYALIYPLFAAGSLAVHKIKKRQAFRFLNVLLVAMKKERQSSSRPAALNELVLLKLWPNLALSDGHVFLIVSSSQQ